MKQRFLEAVQVSAFEEDQCIPERCLLRAILERTLRDIFGIKGERPAERESHHRRAALKWVGLGRPFSTLPRPAPFSFQWVCCYLRLDPEFIHRKLAQALDHEPTFNRMKLAMTKHGFKKFHNPYTLKKSRLNKLAA